MATELTAMLSKVIFESPDKSFAVAEFIDASSAKRFKASGRITTIGKNSTQQQYRLFGEFEEKSKYGETFTVIYAEPMRPQTIAGIIPFLVNNVRGVGEVTATKMLETIGVKGIDDFVEVCKKEPKKIYDYFKSRRNLAQAVITLMTGDEVYRAIMVFLHEHQIPPNFAERIYEKYGAEAVHMLSENPYRLISDFRNVGFLKADAIARKLGISITSPFRIEAAFIYVLEMASSDGHCCLPRDVLIDRAQNILEHKSEHKFTPEFVLTALRTIYKQYRDNNEPKFIIRNPLTADARNETLFYLPEYFDLENRAAGNLLQTIHSAKTKSLPEQELPKTREDLEILLPDMPWEKLSDEQLDAVLTSVASNVMVLTGGPGCGKTFVLRAIYKVQRALNRKVALCAPTGLAAKRMSASIEAFASTIHKLLRLGQDEKLTNESSGSALEGVDVVIVDEASMINLELFVTLLESLGPSRQLILVGDADQLPSVGAGNCLRDVMNSGMVPVAKLTKIFRQSAESPIPLAAREIINGKKPTYTATLHTHAFTAAEAFAFIGCNASVMYQILNPFLKETIRTVYGLDPVKDCQILVPMRKGEVGQTKLNELLQNDLNPPSDDKAQCQLGPNFLLRTGDKVMQTRNNYDKEVFNGDMGYIREIRKTADALQVVVDFVDKSVTLEDDEIYELQLCYAMTVHKSQGSEFPLCIIPMFSQYYSMLDRNLLYTAVTRASRYVILIGEDWAIKKAIQSVTAQKRFTYLEQLLKSGI